MVISVTKDAGAATLLDQQQLVIDTTGGILAIGGNSEQKLAQVVTAGISGFLSEVRFPVSGSSGNLVVAIQDVTDGKPNGIVLASEVFSAANLPPLLSDPNGFRSFAFSTPTSVSGGKSFAVVLTSTGRFSVAPGPLGNPYAGGDAFFDARPNSPGIWIPLGQKSDLPFQTLVRKPSTVSGWNMRLVWLIVLLAGLLVALSLIK